MITSPNIRFPSSEENAVAGGDGSDLRKKDRIFFGGADIARLEVVACAVFYQMQIEKARKIAFASSTLSLYCI